MDTMDSILKSLERIDHSADNIRKEVRAAAQYLHDIRKELPPNAERQLSVHLRLILSESALIKSNVIG